MCVSEGGHAIPFYHVFTDIADFAVDTDLEPVVSLSQARIGVGDILRIGNLCDNGSGEGGFLAYIYISLAYVLAVDNPLPFLGAVNDDAVAFLADIIVVLHSNGVGRGICPDIASFQLALGINHHLHALSLDSATTHQS